MTDERSSDLLSALPRSRPHRRSAKRPTREVSAPETGAERAPAKTSQVARKDTATKASRPAATSTRSAAKPPKAPKAAKSAKSAKSAKGAAKPPTGSAKPAARTTAKAAARTTAKRAARTTARPAQPKSTAPKTSQPVTTRARGVTAAGSRPARPSRPGKPLAQPAQPRGVPRGNRGQRPEPSTEFPVLRTALQAAAEMTEIGVTLSTKALRRALGRLPRP